MKTKHRTVGRRDFFKATSLSAGLLLVKPETAFGTTANSTLQIGMIGSGGRGTQVAVNFVENSATRVSALADLFQDQLDSAKERLSAANQKKGAAGEIKSFKGPESYRELLETDVDIVLISSPPYYHPEHLEAALSANKHVYLEKPVATDVHGCRKILELSRKVQGKVSVDVGFQIRRGPYFVELTRRLHEGAVGEIVMAQGYYFAGDLPRRAKPGMKPEEARIRDWFFDRVLSGDILVEQNVHIVDLFNWVLKSHPLRAEATGGRKVRTDIGDVWDHYIVTYYYPNDVRASFSSTQFLPTWGDVCARFFGPKGHSESYYVGGLRVRGENAWEAGAEAAAPGTRPEVDPLGDATPEKVKAFVSGIQSGQFHNELSEGARSTLSAILGRQAAYEGAPVTWSQMMASDQHWTTDLDLSRI